MGLYSTPPNILPISSNYPERSNRSQVRSQTYPGINVIPPGTHTRTRAHTHSQSPTNLTLENASLHSQLIATKRELARREAQLSKRREAEMVGSRSKLSPQFYSQVQGQYQGPSQSQYQAQASVPIQSQARLVTTDTETNLRIAIEDLHASIRDFADVYGRDDFGSTAFRKEKEKDRRGREKGREEKRGSVTEVWSAIPDVLKIGVREMELQRGVFKPSVLKGTRSPRNSHNNRRDSMSYPSSSSSEERGRDRDRYYEKDGKHGAGVRTLLAALLTREIYLATWENTFFLADEPNAIRTRYKERRKAASDTSLGRGGRRDERGGRRDSRDSKDGRDSRENRMDEVDTAMRMITRSTILGDTFRDLWNFSPSSALSWRTQYFVAIYQELLTSSSSSSSSLSPSNSTSSINHTLLTFISTLTSSILAGELAQLLRNVSSKEDMLMRKDLCGILGKVVNLIVRLRVFTGLSGRERVEVGDVGNGLRMGSWRGGLGGEMVELKRVMIGGSASGRGYDQRFGDRMDVLEGRRVDAVISPVIYIVGEGSRGLSAGRVLVPAVVALEDDW